MSRTGMPRSSDMGLEPWALRLRREQSMRERHWIGMVMSLTLSWALKRHVGRAPGRNKPLANRTTTMRRHTVVRW